MDSGGATHDYFAALILLDSLGLCVGGIGHVLSLTNTATVWQGWTVAFFSILSTSTLLVSNCNTGWAGAEYTTSYDTPYIASDILICCVTVSSVAMTAFVVAWLLKSLYDA